MKAVCFVLLASAAASLAGVLNVTGNTTGQPAWNRPVGGTPPTPPASTVGTAVPYQVTQLYVTAPGSYDFMSTATVPAGWDNYAFLYQDSFNPAAPFANVLVGDDDSPIIGLAGFSYNLNPGTQYYFVETGFGNTDFGAYSLEVRGPGDIYNAVVPEPGQIAMMSLTVIGALGYAGRNWLRRRQ